MATGNSVRQTEAIDICSPLHNAEPRLASLSSRRCFGAEDAVRDLRKARNPIGPINNDPSTSVFLVPKRSTTSGENDL
jgi:hypothetical protein